MLLSSLAGRGRRAAMLKDGWENAGTVFLATYRDGWSFSTLSVFSYLILLGLVRCVALKQKEEFYPWIANANEECGMSRDEGTRPDSGTVLAKKRTELAIKRSAIAAERTLMAWIRTAISMIGFGFTIYKFFQYLPAEAAKGHIPHPHGPRNLGLTLIMLGTLALAGATWQHWNFRKDLGISHFQHMWSISFTVAIGVVVIGILTFYGVLLRLV